MTDNYERFMISQVAVWIRDGKVLILEDAGHPGEWVLPGGRIDVQEDPQKAFARELKEEINMDAFRVIKRIDMEVWYTKNKRRPYCAVAYLVESDHQDIQLSFEHTSFKWISEEEISEYPYLWECAGRMLQTGFDQLRQSQPSV